MNLITWCIPGSELTRAPGSVQVYMYALSQFTGHYIQVTVNLAGDEGYVYLRPLSGVTVLMYG